MAMADVQFHQRYGNAAQIASAAIALIGFGAVLIQINELRHNNRAVGARQIYLAYTDLNFKNPQFGIPDYEKIRTDPLIFEQYKSFVSYLLYACGEALYAFPKDASWRKSCEYEVKGHLPFLCETRSNDPQFLESFGQDTIDFVKATMAREKVAAPDCKLKKA
jgi:hypothetical protein